MARTLSIDPLCGVIRGRFFWVGTHGRGNANAAYGLGLGKGHGVGGRDSSHDGFYGRDAVLYRPVGALRVY